MGGKGGMGGHAQRAGKGWWSSGFTKIQKLSVKEKVWMDGSNLWIPLVR